MDNKKELLNEESYQKGKKKIIALAIIVLIVGILIGGSLIATGIIKSKNAQTNTTEQRSVEVIQKEMDDINDELAKLKTKRNEEFEKNGFSEEYYKLSNEIDKKEDKVSELDTEIWNSKNGYNEFSSKFSSAKYIPFYIFGGFIILASCTWSFSIYFFAKRREILAFTTQQVMPVAQEGIEKMTPTASKAMGTVAKEISKGIKEGLKDDENKKDE